MIAIINYSEESPHFKLGEKQRIVENLVEVHYNYDSPMSFKSVAFESEDTGFTLQTDWIKDFEVFN